MNANHCCPACGEENPSEQRRCATCGSRLPEPPPDDGHHRTLFGIPSPLRADAPAAAPEPAPEPELSRQTLFGGPAVVAASVQAPSPHRDPAAPPRPKEDAAVEKGTLFGVPAPAAAAQAPSPHRDPAPPPRPKEDAAVEKGTLFGVPSPLRGPAPTAAVPPSDSAGGGLVPATDDLRDTLFDLGPVPWDEPEPEPPATAPPASLKHTLMGQPGPSVAPAPARGDPAARRAQADPPRSPVRSPDRSPDRSPVRSIDRSPVRSPVRSIDRPPVRSIDRPVDPSADRDDEIRAARRRKRDAELYAAARIAAAIDEEQRNAGGRRLRTGLIALVAVALVATGFAGLVLWKQHAFRAELTGDLRVQRAGAQYNVKVSIRVSAPALVEHPGGETPVEGEHTLEFTLEDAVMEVGDNRVELRVIPEADPDEVRTLALEVRVYYRFVFAPRAPPKLGTPVPLDVEVLDGWALEIDGGRVTRRGARFHAALDPAPLIARIDRLGGRLGPPAGGAPMETAELPVRLTLHGPDGETLKFSESLWLPFPQTPLVVLGPPHGWARAVDRVVVRGQTAPKTQVTVAGIEGVSDQAGRFAVEVPLPAVGPRTLELSARAPARRVVTATVKVERLGRKAARSRRAKLLSRGRRWLGRARRPPAYRRLLADAEALTGRRIRLEGEVIDVRRATPAEAPVANVIQVVTCGRGCPVWVDAGGPAAVARGDRAVVFGALAGKRDYRTQVGQTLTVPRVSAEYVVGRFRE